MITIETKCGYIKGNERDNSFEFLGVTYAKAGRFEYATLIDKWEETYDATHFRDACPQKRQFYPHYENKERLFYHKEFREGLEFTYSEDCLNLNIWAPKDGKNHPVIIFIHGGGFDSGCNSESNIDGDAYAKRGITMIAINYRVGVFGYFVNEEIFNKYGREGNYGLDDQVKAIQWVKENIESFGGDPNNITLMGQSAGAMSIQYLCNNKKNKGLFQKAIMMSGAGLFPRFSLPRIASNNRDYWNEVIKNSGCTTLDEFKKLNHQKLFDSIEIQRQTRKDNTYHNMPVIDGLLIEKPVDEAIKEAMDIPYIIGYTNNDMYAFLMQKIGLKFAKDHNGYTYYFDIDAPGDKNKAFHSSDLRYAFGTLNKSWRPYTSRDDEISSMMIDYFANFAKQGNPNGENLPIWNNKANRSLIIKSKNVKMGRPSKLKLFVNTIYGLKIR